MSPQTIPTAPPAKEREWCQESRLASASRKTGVPVEDLAQLEAQGWTSYYRSTVTGAFVGYHRSEPRTCREILCSLADKPPRSRWPFPWIY